jgi:hypothetical protein
LQKKVTFFVWQETQQEQRRYWGSFDGGNGWSCGAYGDQNFMNACLQKSCVIMCFSSLFLLQQAFFRCCVSTSANPNVEMHFVGVCKKLQIYFTPLLYMQVFHNPSDEGEFFYFIGPGE